MKSTGNDGNLTDSQNEDMYSGLNYSIFRRKVQQLIGIDLDDYKSDQMNRRLRTIMQRSGAKNLSDYARLLEKDATRLKEFSDYLTINVSEFFRDADRFKHLQTVIIPALLSEKPRLSIWSAGCSNGSEPYSIAIILEEISPFHGHRILATDIDEKILNRAKEGKDYKANDVKNVPPLYLKKYFTQNGDNFSINENIRKKPIFKKQNLLIDEFEKNFDLILCRNVVIYFTTEAKEKLFARFSNSLRPGGILFVGATEIIQNAQKIGLKNIRPSFYQRIS